MLDELAVGEAIEGQFVMVISLPVGAMPMKSPVCVPEKLAREKTRSPTS
jgi:hypothetical protein